MAAELLHRPSWQSQVNCVILAATQTRRPDLNERTWKLAADA
jgi:DNA polymerase IIIc chi subunit